MPKIECPKCQTSYQAERLGIKVGPKEKSLLWCKICGAKLQIRVREEVATVPVPRSWRQLWLKQPDQETVSLLVEVQVLGD